MRMPTAIADASFETSGAPTEPEPLARNADHVAACRTIAGER